MASVDNFCLRWADFGSAVAKTFRELRENSDFFDVTLATADSGIRTLQAHKVILSASSTIFKEMLRGQAWLHSHPRPVIYLRGVNFSDLQSILDFVYHGEVSIAQENISSFLTVAEELKIKGLATPDQSELLEPSDSDSSPPSSKDWSMTDRTIDSNSTPPPSKRTRRSTARSMSVKTRNNESNNYNNLFNKDKNVDNENKDKNSYNEKKVKKENNQPKAEKVRDDSTGFDDSVESDNGMKSDEPGTRGSRDGQRTIVPELMDVMQFLEPITSPQGQRKHHCTLCGMISPHNSTMRRHMLRIHASPVELPCRNCSKIFKSSPNLEAHERLCSKK